MFKPPMDEIPVGGGGPNMESHEQLDTPIQDEELDPEFIQEIKTYLEECMENNEVSIDMSDTLIRDHGAKMVATAVSFCEQL